jgi:hypothetical protein
MAAARASSDMGDSCGADLSISNLEASRGEVGRTMFDGSLMASQAAMASRRRECQIMRRTSVAVERVNCVGVPPAYRATARERLLTVWKAQSLMACGPAYSYVTSPAKRPKIAGRARRFSVSREATLSTTCTETWVSWIPLVAETAT